MESSSLLLRAHGRVGMCPSCFISDGTDDVAPAASPSKPGVTLGTRPASSPQPPGDVISHCLLIVSPVKARTWPRTPYLGREVTQPKPHGPLSLLVRGPHAHPHVHACTHSTLKPLTCIHTCAHTHPHHLQACTCTHVHTLIHSAYMHTCTGKAVTRAAPGESGQDRLAVGLVGSMWSWAVSLQAAGPPEASEPRVWSGIFRQPLLRWGQSEWEARGRVGWRLQGACEDGGGGSSRWMSEQNGQIR